MIYDCFTFFNELDLLEIRLDTLKDVVDRFVIAEATRTHTGKEKELLFEKNRERFAEFADKITYVVVDDLLPEEEVGKDSYNLPWVNENRQRNALMRGLSGAKDDDVIMVSDLDEIPRPEYVAKTLRLISSENPARLILGNYNYYLNFRNCFYPDWRLGTVMSCFSDFLNGELIDRVESNRYIVAHENQGRTITKLRFCPCKLTVANAGWHFSYLGGVDAVLNKLKSFSHSEFSRITRNQIEARLLKGEDVFGRGEKFFAEPIDSRFPRIVCEDMIRWRNLIHPCDEHYLLATRWRRRRVLWCGKAYRFLVSLIPDSMAHVLIRFRNQVLDKVHGD